MRICMCRVDDRLIHGQITTVWVRQLKISNIFVVDDELSRDRLATKVLCMSAPVKVEVHVLSVTQMAAALQNQTVKTARQDVMLLFRSLTAAKALFAEAGRIFDTLSLGGMPSRIGRHEIGKNLFFSREERALVLDMMKRYDLSVISQVLPSDTPVDVGALIRDNYDWNKDG